MESLTSQELTALFFALGLLLAFARLLGEIARRFNQPSVLGEILAGLILGPTILGRLAPDVSLFLFPQFGDSALVFDAFMSLAITLFLLVAGLEVNLSTVWRQGKSVLVVGNAGILVPFGLGFATAWFLPRAMGIEAGADPLIFALFIATALSISALPVIAKTLMDLNLYRSDFGMIVIASAVLNDLAGWIIFAIILGMLGTANGHVMGVGETIGLTLLFTLLMLTVGRSIFDRMLLWIQAHSASTSSVIGFVLVVALVSAAVTEWFGVHLIFGAFIAGVALGDSSHLRARTRSVIEQFVSVIFAPLFFASIGLRVDFIANFDPGLVAIVIVIACLGKVLGCGLGGRSVGMPGREALALGFAMNARGAMEIILGLLALRYGLISERLFVALVAMALVTSMMSGPLIQKLLRLKKPRRFFDSLGARTFVPHLQAIDRESAIDELAHHLGETSGRDPQELAAAAIARERLMATGVGHGVAIPHARIAGLSAPLVGVGISGVGIDFDAPDGESAHLIFLIYTPDEAAGVQLEILADIASTFSSAEVREQALRARGYSEFLAAVKSAREK
jgi:Kef-type K+ transport system membrane component KefB/mannitol/fructose-specific phosphotransferase system IIA component (Ntr-type)